METKQTAVEWLQEQYYESEGKLTRQDFEQAKKMENEQNITAYKNGYVVQRVSKQTFKTREMKQTAVDFFWNKIALKLSVEQIVEFLVVFEQAKQMEKEQMIEFTDKVLDNTIGDLILLYSVEKIYNETYGNQNK